jgi:uncharacterized LabA/DUF88 family protein
MSIGLFIDGAYVYKVAGKIDHLKLRTFLEREMGGPIDEAYFFNADDDPPKAEKLHSALTMLPPHGPGFRVKIYWLQKKNLYWPPELGGHPVMHPTIPDLQYQLITQKAVDVGLVFHMTRSYHKRKWNKLVLAAGDGDFHEPIQNLVESENVDLFLVGTHNSISSELRPYARKVYELDKEPLISEVKLTGR